MTDTRPPGGRLEPPDTVSHVAASGSRPRGRSLGTENNFQQDGKRGGLICSCDPKGAAGTKRLWELWPMPSPAGTADAAEVRLLWMQGQREVVTKWDVKMESWGTWE